eukprot:gene32746-40416_t
MILALLALIGDATGRTAILDLMNKAGVRDARGNKGFPNLTDKDWLYGGAPDIIKTTIMNGRHGVMPPMGAALGSDKDVEHVAHYVLSLSGGAADPIKAVFGKSKFNACMGCHTGAGTGNQALGAPNLADKVWLYGGSAETIMETIRKGRSNTMPAFADFLGEGKVHVLAAYVLKAASMNAPEQVIKMYAAREEILMTCSGAFMLAAFSL